MISCSLQGSSLWQTLKNSLFMENTWREKRIEWREEYSWNVMENHKGLFSEMVKTFIFTFYMAKSDPNWIGNYKSLTWRQNKYLKTRVVEFPVMLCIYNFIWKPSFAHSSKNPQSFIIIIFVRFPDKILGFHTLEISHSLGKLSTFLFLFSGQSTYF